MTLISNTACPANFNVLEGRRERLTPASNEKELSALHHRDGSNLLSVRKIIPAEPGPEKEKRNKCCIRLWYQPGSRSIAALLKFSNPLQAPTTTVGDWTRREPFPGPGDRHTQLG